jgi:hypothetical protein
MTKEEFLSRIPSYILSPSGTKGLRIQITIDSSFRKGACYKDDHEVAACYAFGYFWDEVYEKLMAQLKSRGYLISKPGVNPTSTTGL